MTSTTRQDWIFALVAATVAGCGSIHSEPNDRRYLDRRANALSSDGGEVSNLPAASEESCPDSAGDVLLAAASEGFPHVCGVVKTDGTAVDGSVRCCRNAATQCRLDPDGVVRCGPPPPSPECGLDSDGGVTCEPRQERQVVTWVIHAECELSCCTISVDVDHDGEC